MTVHVIATGGTIASHHNGSEWTNLTGRELVAALDDATLERVGGITVRDVATGPSSHLGVDDMVSIARHVLTAIDEGATGVVVTHGTDTMELTAFVTQLLRGTVMDSHPVVFTGSMRVHSHREPDGPTNLRDAVLLAAHPSAVGRDIMIALDGAVHAADRARKRNAVSIDAFDSHPLTPMARVDGGVVSFGESVRRRRDRASGLDVTVPLVTCYPGIEPQMVSAGVADAVGYVLEVFGDLNVPASLWPIVHRSWGEGALVVLASRSFTPAIMTDDLMLLGGVGAGGLSAQKARLAAMAALTTCADRDEAVAFLAQYALPADTADRRTS